MADPIRPHWRQILHDAATTQHTAALTWTECNLVLAELADFEEALSAGDACGAIGCRALADRDRYHDLANAQRGDAARLARIRNLLTRYERDGGDAGAVLIRIAGAAGVEQ